MICVSTTMKTSDNSGAKLVKCIHIYKGKFNRVKLGDMILVIIKRAKPRKKVKKSELKKAVLIRKKEKTARKNGIQINFKKNLVLLIDKNKNPIGNRFKGPIPIELRFQKYMKIISMTKSII